MQTKNVLGIALAFKLALEFDVSFAQTDFWQQKMSGVHVGSLATRPNGEVFTATSTGNVFVSTDHGDSWIQSTLSHDVVSAFAFSKAGSIVASARSGAIYRSTDNGASWTITDSTVFLLSMRMNSVVTTTNGYLFAGATRNISPCPCGYGVYRSTDDGTSWQCTSLTRGIGPMMATAQGQLFASSDSLFRSTDDGDTWTNSSSGLNSAYINSLGASANGLLLAGTSQGLFRSTDNGDHWTVSGLVNISVNAIVNHSQGTIIAGSDSGISISSNGAMTWKQVNSGLTQTRISSLAIDSSGYAYAGTPDSGIFRSTQVITGIEEFPPPLPGSYSLFQNYPNPFNPTTVISYQLPVTSYHSLKIYDVLGREVAILVNGTTSPGTHKVLWDASAFPSGVYFYRLQARQTTGGQAGSFTETMKLIVLR